MDGDDDDKETKRRMTFGTRWLPPSLYDLHVWQELAAPATPAHALAKQVENSEFWNFDSSASRWQVWLLRPGCHMQCAGVFGTLRISCSAKMERVQPHGSNLATSTIKIQKLSSFPRSLKEHFSLKPCKVILVIFIHAWIYRLHPTMLQVSSEASLFIRSANEV